MYRDNATLLARIEQLEEFVKSAEEYVIVMETDPGWPGGVYTRFKQAVGNVTKEPSLKERFSK